MKQRLLVAGNGFVGQTAARQFRSAGWEVITVSRSGEGDVHADLSKDVSVKALRTSVDAPSHILFCASAGGGVDAYRAVYLEGARNLVRHFPNVPIIFTSSISVYPQSNGEVVTEESTTEVQRETGKLLLESESVILNAGGIVLRLAGLYGIGRAYLLRRLLVGEAELEDDGGRVLNYTHHEDAAGAALFLCEKSQWMRGEVYNVCDSHPLTQKELYLALVKKFDLAFPPSVPRNLNSKRGWSSKAVSNKKLRALGWQPKYPSFVDASEEVAASL